MRWLIATLAAAAALLSGCGEQRPAAPAPMPTELFNCAQTLIGLETVYCHEDVIGPGILTLSLQVDPEETSWELRIRGLAALAEQCEFHGHFDQTRLSALQGRGETEIICPIAAGVDRQYHEFSFENLLDAPNTAINVALTFTR